MKPSEALEEMRRASAGWKQTSLVTPPEIDDLRAAVYENQPEPLSGSNMWAIGPAKSASGRAMLLINLLGASETKN